jgi:hypothetical protein
MSEPRYEAIIENPLIIGQMEAHAPADDDSAGNGGIVSACFDRRT